MDDKAATYFPRVLCISQIQFICNCLLTLSRKSAFQFWCVKTPVALQAKTLHAIAFEASRLELAGTALLENLESPKAKKKPGKAATVANAPKVGTSSSHLLFLSARHIQ